MSIESFHNALHGAGDAEPMLAKLRAIARIEDPALMLAADDEMLVGWINWVDLSQSTHQGS